MTPESSQTFQGCKFIGIPSFVIIAGRKRNMQIITRKAMRTSSDPVSHYSWRGASTNWSLHKIVLTHLPLGGYGRKLKLVIFKFISRIYIIVSVLFFVKMPSGECHKTSLMIRQHDQFLLYYDVYCYKTSLCHNALILQTTVSKALLVRIFFYYDVNCTLIWIPLKFVPTGLIYIGLRNGLVLTHLPLVPYICVSDSGQH